MIEITENIYGEDTLKREYQLDKHKCLRERSSNNDFAIKVLNWSYEMSLKDGLTKTYKWIYSELKKEKFNINPFTKS